MTVNIYGINPDPVGGAEPHDQSPQSSTPSEVCLDAQAFPHIFRQVIRCLDKHTLTAVLRCSRSTRDIPTPYLHRNITLVDGRTFSLYISATSEVRDNGLGDRLCYESDPSPSVKRPRLDLGGRTTGERRATHEYTRSLSIYAPLAPTTISRLTSGLLPNLHYLRLSYRYPLCWGKDLPYETLYPSAIKHLIVRAPIVDLFALARVESYRRDQLPPPTLRNITFLASTYSTIKRRYEFGHRSQSITLVFLPVSLPHQPTNLGNVWRERFGGIMDTIARWSCNSLADLTIVGLEYGQGYATGHLPVSFLQAGLASRQRPSLAENPIGGPGEWAADKITFRQVTFRRFEDWVDEQEAGVMFGQEEEKALRALSAEHRERWGSTPCPEVTPQGAAYQ